MNLVLDNSVTMRWCFGDGMPEDLEYAGRVLDALSEGTAHVPPLWHLEVANVLVRAEHHGHVNPSHSDAFLALLQKLDVITDAESTQHVITDVLALARAQNLTAYDAAYLELAKRKQLPLATLDAHLRQACTSAGVTVFV